MSADQAAAATAIEERPEAHMFVGNLSYQLRQHELKEFIEKHAGETYTICSIPFCLCVSVLVVLLMHVRMMIFVFWSVFMMH